MKRKRGNNNASAMQPLAKRTALYQFLPMRVTRRQKAAAATAAAPAAAPPAAPPAPALTAGPALAAAPAIGVPSLAMVSSGRKVRSKAPKNAKSKSPKKGIVYQAAPITGEMDQVGKKGVRVQIDPKDDFMYSNSNSLHGVPQFWKYDVCEAISVFLRQIRYVTTDERAMNVYGKQIVSVEFIDPSAQMMDNFKNEMKMSLGSSANNKLLVTFHGTSLARADGIFTKGFNTNTVWTAGSPSISAYYSVRAHAIDNKLEDVGSSDLAIIACKTIVDTSSEDFIQTEWADYYRNLTQAVAYSTKPKATLPFLLIRFRYRYISP